MTHTVYIIMYESECSFICKEERFKRRLVGVAEACGMATERVRTFAYNVLISYSYLRLGFGLRLLGTNEG